MNTPRLLHHLRPSPSRARGYTLTEVLVVVVIVGILTAVAIPSFNQFEQKSLIQSEVSALTSAIRLTRTEAFKRRTPVTICASANPEDAAPQCTGAAAADWSLGWLVFVDGGAVLGQLEAGETVIQVQPPFRNSGGITNNALGSLTFQSTGLPVGLAASTFTVLPKQADAANSKAAQIITLSAQGRATVAKKNP